jgi:fucose permease
MAALLCYIFTESYPVLLIAMIFSLGASTMLSTSLNVVTPLLFVSPALYINLFNFTNGMGIFSAQNIGGRVASSMKGWHGFNLVLLCLGVIGLVILSRIRFPKQEIQKSTGIRGTIRSYGSVFRNPACKYLICICGFYAIAEHGIQNWMVTYGSEYLGYTRTRASLYLSIFFGGITLGRLIFAPLVQKLGPAKSVTLFTGIGMVLYTVGIFLERAGIVPLLLSGLAFSIQWPTIVLTIGTYYPKSQNGIAVGMITSLATIFDVIFNAGFGTLVERLGFSIGFKLLPIAAIALFLLFVIMRKRTTTYAGAE